MLRFAIDACLFTATWIIILPVATGSVRYRHLSGECRVIYFFTIIACLAEFASYFTRRRGINNMPLLHIYTVIEFLMISWFYHTVFKKKYPGKLLLIIAIVFLCFSVINSLFFQKIISFNSNVRGIEALLIVLYALIFFYLFFFQPDTKDMADDPSFWINTGLLVYFSGAATLFILSNYILPMGYQFNKTVWGLHALLCILMYLSITFGLWKHKME